MTDIDDFVHGLCVESAAEEPVAELDLNQGYDDFVEAVKQASCDTGWLQEFEGTPYYDAAIALVEEETAEEAARIQERIKRQKLEEQIRSQMDQAHPKGEDRWSRRDMRDLKKRQLELEALKWKHGQKTASVQTTGQVNTGEAEQPSWPVSSLGVEAAGRRATAEELKQQNDTATPQHLNHRAKIVDHYLKRDQVKTALSGKAVMRALEGVTDKSRLARSADKARRILANRPGEAADTLAHGAGLKARSDKHWKLFKKTRESLNSYPSKAAALQDSAQEAGLARAVRGLSDSKIDADRKAGLAKGLRRAVKTELAEKDPAPALGKEAGVLDSIAGTLRGVGSRLGQTTQRQVMGRMPTQAMPTLSRNAPVQNVAKSVGKTTIPMDSRQAKSLYREVAKMRQQKEGLPRNDRLRAGLIGAGAGAGLVGLGTLASKKPAQQAATT